MITTIFPNENSFRMPHMLERRMSFSLWVTPRHWIPMGSNDSINSPAIFLLCFMSNHFFRNGWILGGTWKQGSWIRDSRFGKPLLIISGDAGFFLTFPSPRSTCSRIKRLRRHRPALFTRYSALRDGPTMVYCNTLVYGYSYHLIMRTITNVDDVNLGLDLWTHIKNYTLIKISDWKWTRKFWSYQLKF